MARMLQQRFPRGSARRRAAFLGAVALSTLSCNAFKLTGGPDEAPPVNPPGTVSVTVEYDQVPECVEGSPRCADNVVFFDRKDVDASMTGYQDARRFSDSVFRFGVPVRVVWFVGTASPLGG